MASHATDGLEAQGPRRSPRRHLSSQDPTEPVASKKAAGASKKASSPPKDRNTEKGIASKVAENQDSNDVSRRAARPAGKSPQLPNVYAARAQRLSKKAPPVHNSEASKDADEDRVAPPTVRNAEDSLIQRPTGFPAAASVRTVELTATLDPIAVGWSRRHETQPTTAQIEATLGNVAHPSNFENPDREGLFERQLTPGGRLVFDDNIGESFDGNEPFDANQDLMNLNLGPLDDDQSDSQDAGVLMEEYQNFFSGKTQKYDQMMKNVDGWNHMSEDDVAELAQYNHFKALQEMNNPNQPFRWRMKLNMAVYNMWRYFNEERVCGTQVI